MKSRRRMRALDGSTNGRKLHSRLKQFRSHQMNDRVASAPLVLDSSRSLYASLVTEAVALEAAIKL
jgi:hypothetical protein